MYQIIHGDCLDVLPTLAEHSVDLILCDLPYGSTVCQWDSRIDLAALWTQYKRIIKPYHAIVLTASQPFTTILAMSNLPWLRYEWIWVKNRPTNFAHAKNKPMKKHENVLVFSEGTTVHPCQSKHRMPYHPQGLRDTNDARQHVKRPAEKTDAFFADRASHRAFTRDKTGYPHSVLEFATDQLGLHPTAKPVALLEYLIQTYTVEGGVVLDNCCGVGSTGIACARAGRQFIGIEVDQHFSDTAQERITDAFDGVTYAPNESPDDSLITWGHSHSMVPGGFDV